MKKIIIDIDDVLCQPTFLDEVNRFLGTNYTLEDCILRYFDEIFGSEENKQRFYQTLKTKNLYLNAEIYENAIDTLLQLNEKFDIYICSSCIMQGLETESGLFFKHKYDFLIKNFPFLNPKHFIFSNNKNIFNVDIQIDDNICHLQNDTDIKILFTAHHNKDLPDETLSINNIIRMNNWKEIGEYLLSHTD